MQRATRSLVALLLLAFLLGCNGSAGSSKDRETTLEKVRRTGELHVGYLVFSPCINHAPETNRKQAGFFVDMIEHIAENLKVKVVYHETTLKDFAAGLNTHQFDISICPTYRTISRASAVAFTRPIFYMGNGAVALRNANRTINDKTDLDDPNLRIAVLQGQAMDEYARVHWPNAKVTRLSTGDLTAPLLEVSTGKADVGFCNYLDVERYCATHPEVVNIFKQQPIEVVPLGWAVRSSDLPWLAFIDTAIDYMDSTGRINQWEDQYGSPLLHEKRTFELRKPRD